MVSTNLPNRNRTIVELREFERRIWKYIAMHNKLPQELESRLSDFIVNISLKKWLLVNAIFDKKDLQL